MDILTPEQKERFAKAAPELRQEFLCPQPTVDTSIKTALRRYLAYQDYRKRHGKRPCRREYEQNKWMNEEK
jgi:hypothetical protein